MHRFLQKTLYAELISEGFEDANHRLFPQLTYKSGNVVQTTPIRLAHQGA